MMNTSDASVSNNNQPRNIDVHGNHDVFPTHDLRAAVATSLRYSVTQKPLNSALFTTAIGLIAGAMVTGGNNFAVKITGTALASVCAGRAIEAFSQAMHSMCATQKHRSTLPPEKLAEANTRIKAEFARHQGVVDQIYHEIDGVPR